MSAKRSEEFSDLRARLLADGIRLREEIRSGLVRSRVESPEAVAGLPHDLGDEAFADLSADLVISEVGRDVAELRDVDAALSRIAEGTYGTCADCARPIGLDRLGAYPTAKRCLVCQSALDRPLAGRVPSL